MCLKTTAKANFFNPMKHSNSDAWRTDDKQVMSETKAARSSFRRTKYQGSCETINPFYASRVWKNESRQWCRCNFWSWNENNNYNWNKKRKQLHICFWLRAQQLRYQRRSWCSSGTPGIKREALQVNHMVQKWIQYGINSTQTNPRAIGDAADVVSS